MRTNQDPKEVAISLLGRSICSVQVAAVLADKWGIFAWGWNNSGDGFGEHAEAHAMRRANFQRVKNATLYVAAKRKRNNSIVIAKPCRECERLAIRCQEVVWRDKDGIWK